MSVVSRILTRPSNPVSVPGECSNTLSGAHLNDANLAGAQLSGTVLAGANLAGAKRGASSERLETRHRLWPAESGRRRA